MAKMRSSMRPLLVIGAVLLVVAGIELYSYWSSADPRELVAWQSDLAAAQAQAKAEHKRVFAYFTASWCGPCQQMKRTTWADAKVERAMRKYVPVKIDVDAEQALARQYRVDSLPRFYILSEDGQVVRKTTGGMSAEEMIGWMER